LKIYISLFAFLFLLNCQIVQAEYRVYQYIVQNKIKTNDEPAGKIMLSSLDPVSFGSYHGGHDLVEVELLRTWICPGYTGESRDYCASPYERLAAEVINE
jgi:hypothetical protein